MIPELEAKVVERLKKLDAADRKKRVDDFDNKIKSDREEIQPVIDRIMSMAGLMFSFSLGYTDKIVPGENCLYAYAHRNRSVDRSLETIKKFAVRIESGLVRGYVPYGTGWKYKTDVFMERDDDKFAEFLATMMTPEL